MRVMPGPPQTMRTPQWARLVDPAHGMLVQIGAHDHANHGYANPDVGPLCVSRGWRALLVEPMSEAFSRLKAQYKEKLLVDNGRLRLLNSAVCGSCDQHESVMWAIDLSNPTSMAMRCLAALNDTYGWVGELASLSRRHVIKHDYVFNWRVNECKICAERLGVPALRPNCMHKVLGDNVQRRVTKCACLEHELQSEESVTLLLVDAEGFDADILRRYPFGRVPTTRVMFEKFHLNASAVHATAELLRSHGFMPVPSESYKDAYTETWHHTTHDTPLLVDAVAKRTHSTRGTRIRQSADSYRTIRRPSE